MSDLAEACNTMMKKVHGPVGLGQLSITHLSCVQCHVAKHDQPQYAQDHPTPIPPLPPDSSSIGQPLSAVQGLPLVVSVPAEAGLLAVQRGLRPGSCKRQQHFTIFWRMKQGTYPLAMNRE